MKNIFQALPIYRIVTLCVLLFATQVAEADVIASPSMNAVKEKDGVVLNPDPGSGDTYTIQQGTTLSFEVVAEIQTLQFSSLASEWYNSENPNEGLPIAIVSWCCLLYTSPSPRDA